MAGVFLGLGAFSPFPDDGKRYAREESSRVVSLVGGMLSIFGANSTGKRYTATMLYRSLGSCGSLSLA